MCVYIYIILTAFSCTMALVVMATGKSQAKTIVSGRKNISVAVKLCVCVVSVCVCVCVCACVCVYACMCVCKCVVLNYVHTLQETREKELYYARPNYILMVRLGK